MLKLTCGSFPGKTSPSRPLSITFTPEFFQSSPINFKKKLRSPSNLKKGEVHKTKHSIVYPEFFYAYWYISTVYQSGREGHPPWLGLKLEKFLEIRTTRMLKMDFPAWQFFSKQLILMVSIPIWVTILMVRKYVWV